MDLESNNSKKKDLEIKELQSELSDYSKKDNEINDLKLKLSSRYDEEKIKNLEKRSLDLDQRIGEINSLKESIKKIEDENLEEKKKFELVSGYYKIEQANSEKWRKLNNKLERKLIELKEKLNENKDQNYEEENDIEIKRKKKKVLGKITSGKIKDKKYDEELFYKDVSSYAIEKLIIDPVVNKRINECLDKFKEKIDVSEDETEDITLKTICEIEGVLDIFSEYVAFVIQKQIMLKEKNLPYNKKYSVKFFRYVVNNIKIIEDKFKNMKFIDNKFIF